MRTGDTSSKQRKENQEKHDLAVRMIARELFTFNGGEIQPGIFHPTWVTYVNVPQQQMSIEHMWAGEIYPDIAIVDIAKGNTPRMAAEVETEETLELIETLDKWKYVQDECKWFYVFVPEGCARKAAHLILKYRTAMSVPRALSTYALDDMWNLRLTPV